MHKTHELSGAFEHHQHVASCSPTTTPPPPLSHSCAAAAAARAAARSLPKTTQSALQMAAKGGHIDVIKCLMSSGADINRVR